MNLRADLQEKYELISDEELSELKCNAVYLKHKKSGARIALLLCEDDNKVFSVSFRTTPFDSTGVPHILEHSVLCGSDKYPLKDPFVELAKGSLNTYLNAWTFPDKTMYPIASCNAKDYANLMDVYLDAVFHPLIYSKKAVFLQEGWRYEKKDGELTTNGVVYNEMKGALSDPSELMDIAVTGALFPDTQYSNVSGGDPRKIPELTYENFLKFHETLYHPSNSYIYMYGDIDADERLEYLDREYLSKYSVKDVDSEVYYQDPVFCESSDTYAVSEDEDQQNKAWFSFNAVVNSDDLERLVAMQILDYVLVETPGAPLKQAFIDEGLGEDVSGVLMTESMQPYFSIVVQNADENRREEFEDILKKTLEAEIRNGIDEKALLSALNIFDFKYREADFGAFPKGLIFNMQMMESWLYDDDRPFDFLEQGRIFKDLREKCGQGYFEQLIREELLTNPHQAYVTLYPEVGKNERIQAEIEKELAKVSEAMTDADEERLVNEAEALKQYQDTPDTAEIIQKLPLLSIEDIDRKSKADIPVVTQEDMATFVTNEIYTNGIIYLRMLFDAKHVTEEMVPYLGLLETCLGYVDSEHYSYADIAKEINLHTGGIQTMLTFTGDKDDIGKCKVQMTFEGRCLHEEIDKLRELFEEMAFCTLYTDEKRLKEIINETITRMKLSMEAAGNAVANTRAMSGVSEQYAFRERARGIAYYRFLKDIAANYDERKSEVLSMLASTAKALFTAEGLTVSVTGDEEGIRLGKSAAATFAAKLAKKAMYPELKIGKSSANEGFATSGQVQFCVLAGNYRGSEGLLYTGSMRVLETILNYDYLWTNIRMKGGAYGCNAMFGRAGEVMLSSYRDPNLKNTYAIYEGLAEYLKKFEADEREMTKYIIGTISRLDRPLSASVRGFKSLNDYQRGLSYADIQRERDQILNTTPQDIRDLSRYVETVMAGAVRCTLGSAGKLEAEGDLFDVKEAL